MRNKKNFYIAILLVFFSFNALYAKNDFRRAKLYNQKNIQNLNLNSKKILYLIQKVKNHIYTWQKYIRKKTMMNSRKAT